MTTVKKPAFIAYTVTGQGKNAFWSRIGAAWHHNHDGGLNIDLTSLPLDGRIVLLPPKTSDGLQWDDADTTASQ